VALPSIATPKGGGAIRSIGETFRTNSVTGSGSFAVPLPLSPARADSGPKLALSYDSGQGQGTFGMGWSVDLPSITRRTDKGLPRYRDAEESDEFVLSGAEVLVPALVQSGTSWQRDELDDGPYHVQRYRPRVESAFARIEKRTDRNTGEVHWRTTTRDNVTSFFGWSPSARLVDPKDLRRVFRWLLEATFDDRGNAAWFEYKPEDTANLPGDHVEERRRLADAQSFANEYVKRVHYGNRTKPASAAPTPDDLASLAWLFEVVFDYGEHDVSAPTPQEANPWPCRQDPFSSFRSTFDVRTYRLCRRILMFHQFDELGPSPVLVRSLDLAYEEGPLTTYLRSITETGWQASAAGYTQASTPRLDLDYTRANLETTVSVLAPESVVHVPGGVDGARYRWLDLDGEGIPGVLSQQGGALFYKRNDGGGRLARADALRAQPNVVALGAPEQMLTSLDADGQMDLVLLDTSMRGFFERRHDGWSPFRSFLGVPHVDFQDPNLRFLDVDGDGLADVLIAEDEVFVWSRSLGKEGFERPRVVQKSSDENAGPNFVFADATQSIFLADMTGDGLTDLVRVRNGEICYWPNLGYAHFGAKITMGRAPLFDGLDAFDPKRLRFGDVDGTGTSDIAYVRPDGVAIYLNQAGNRWSDPVLVKGVPVRGDTSVDLVDLLGTGTACLVWSSPQLIDSGRPIGYVDLLASTKPHLLNQVTNNLGLETRVAYAPSTRFYLEDRAAGSPWVTRLPFPVQVIARVETADAVQKTRLVTTYRYKHGYFDGFEREFRGFGRIDQWDAESYSDAHGQGLLPPGQNEQNGELFLPPIHAVTWLDTGAWREARDLYAQYRREWYALDPAAPPLADPFLPDGLTVPEMREAARARKGTVLRREVYADDGPPAAARPYVVEEHRYQVAHGTDVVPPLQPIAHQRHAVFLTHERESVTRHYERSDPPDPRTQHTFTLEIDGYGNVLRSAHVAYPRRQPAEPEQGAVLATCADVTFANETAAFYRLGVSVEARTYELTGLVPPASGGLFAFDEIDAAQKDAITIAYDAAPTAGTLQKRTLSHRRTLYLSEDLSAALPLGSIASRALVYEAYAKALPASLATSIFGGSFPSPAALTAALTTDCGYVTLPGDGDWWRPSGRPTYDATRFYQPTAMRDPFGNTSHVVLDAYALLPVEAHASDDPDLDNVVSSTPDYRVLQPGLVTDPNGNQTAVAFDPLGMVVATAVMGKPGGGEGDTLADPTMRVEYDLLAWQNAQGPAYVHTFAREKHGAQNPRWLESYSYFDGSGQEVMKKIQAEPDPATPTVPRWIGTGRTVFDNKGNPIKKYEPYFAPTPAYEDEPSIVMQGVTPILRYDPLGRLVRTDLPNGTFETVEIDPWGEVHGDANDNVTESLWFAARLPTASPPMSAAEQRAAALAAQHAHTWTTKTVDPLGRTFLVVEDNGPAGRYETRTLLDIEGNPLTVTDARGVAVETTVFAMGGQKLSDESCDAGVHMALADVTGKLVYAWDGPDVMRTVSYDVLRRVTHLFAQTSTMGKILAERTVYGERAQGAAASNLRGRVYQRYDGAGVATSTRFDFKGNLLQTSRQLTSTYQKLPDWSALATITDPAAVAAAAQPALDADPKKTFPSSTTYDALNRPTSFTSPDGSVVVPTYNEANLLEAVSVGLQGASSPTPFLTNLDYDAKGQRVLAAYANGVTTTYTYDPLTFRLAELVTTPSGTGLLQDLSYTYDPVGNITEIVDGAQETVFFDNAVVSPSAQYVYDAIYRLTQATGRELAGGLADVQRDQNDLPLVNLPNPNDTQALRRYTESYAYDAVGNIQKMVHDSGAAATSWTRYYAYETDPGDPTHQKPISNRLVGTSMPGDAPKQFSATYGYDTHGNMISMPHLPTMGWDFKDQLQTTNLAGGGNVYFMYDAAGHRVRKVWEHSGLVEERVYVGGYEVYEKRSATDGSVALARQTLHVMDGVRRIALVETTTADTSAAAFQPSTVTRFQLDNHLGSALLEVDGGGMVISYEEYHPYGTTAYRAGTGAAEVSLKRYRYTGKERDDETGLYYHGARYYAPWLGRWTATDPLGIVDGPDVYAYVRGNPIKSSDPRGTETHTPKNEADRTVMLKTDAELHRYLGKLSPEERLDVAMATTGAFADRAAKMMIKYGMEMKARPMPSPPAEPTEKAEKPPEKKEETKTTLPWLTGGFGFFGLAEESHGIAAETLGIVGYDRKEAGWYAGTLIGGGLELTGPRHMEGAVAHAKERLTFFSGEHKGEREVENILIGEGELWGKKAVSAGLGGFVNEDDPRDLGVFIYGQWGPVTAGGGASIHTLDDKLKEWNEELASQGVKPLPPGVEPPRKVDWLEGTVTSAARLLGLEKALTDYSERLTDEWNAGNPGVRIKRDYEYHPPPR
jgi:RHS repeat-associated protein